MTTGRPQTHDPRGAFTLIELIGVLAIITVLAGVVAPNAIKALDRAAVRAEAATLDRLGEQVVLHLRDHGAPPSVGAWSTALAAYADLAPAEVLRNRRGIDRVYVADPATVPAERVLVLSSMRAGLGLPGSGSLNSVQRFDDVWRTADGAIPPTSTWSGWNAWNAVPGAGEFLLVERVNLRPVYRTDLRPFAVTLNNRSGIPGSGTTAATVSYSIVFANGSASAATNVAAGATVVIPALRSGERVNLFRASGGAALDYVFVVGASGRTFDFNGANWIPQ